MKNYGMTYLAGMLAIFLAERMIEIQKEAWQHLTTFPLTVIWEGFFTPEEPAFAFNALYSCIIGCFVITSFRLVRLGDYALALIFFFLPLCSGIVTLYSMVRYSAVVFPLYIIVGYWIYHKPILKAPAVAIGIFLQLLFMVLWTTGSYYII